MFNVSIDHISVGNFRVKKRTTSLKSLLKHIDFPNMGVYEIYRHDPPYNREIYLDEDMVGHGRAPTEALSIECQWDGYDIMDVSVFTVEVE